MLRNAWACCSTPSKVAGHLAKRQPGKRAQHVADRNSLWLYKASLRKEELPFPCDLFRHVLRENSFSTHSTFEHNQIWGITIFVHLKRLTKYNRKIKSTYNIAKFLFPITQTLKSSKTIQQRCDGTYTTCMGCPGAFTAKIEKKEKGKRLDNLSVLGMPENH